MYQDKSVDKFEWIDLLRGVAILNVIAVHSAINVQGLNSFTIYIFNYGQMGVQLFFVVSAITLCLSMQQRNESSFYNFYVRRYFRIAPLYYIAIGLYFVWLVFKDYWSNRPFEVPNEYSLKYVLANFFFVHGFFPDGYNSSVPGGWSISTEMMFYLTFPFLFLIQKKTQFKKLIIFAVALSVSLLIIKCLLIYQLQVKLILSGYISTFKINYEFINLSILNQMSVFLIGILTYRLIYIEKLMINSWYLIIAFIFTVFSCILLNSIWIQYNPASTYIYPVLSAASFSILALKFSSYSNFNSTISRCLIKIGKYSFSIYVFHFLVLDIVVFLFKKLIFNRIQLEEMQLALIFIMVTFFTYFFSKLSYKYIELKGIGLGKKLLHSKSNQN